MDPRICCHCKGIFTPRRHTQWCCSIKCRQASERKRYTNTILRDKCPAITAGAIKELWVAADLLAKGYEVFRALSPACSCDLIACKNGIRTTIEVRTGQRKKDGGLRCAHSCPKADVLAVVLLATMDTLEYQIVYTPSLE